MNSSMHKTPIALKILLVSAAVFYLVFIARTSFDVQGQRYFTLVDDAMISMRYARNLAGGHGLVWNPGQPPVEGFTNPGWTLVMSLVHLVPLPQASISLVIMLLSALLLLANVVVVHQIVRTIDPDAGLAPLIASVLAAFYFPFVFWSLRGLEVGALVLVLDLALLLTLRLARDPGAVSVSRLCLVLGLAILLRMDAALQVALLLLFAGWTLGAGRRKLPAAFVVPAAVSLLVLAAILVFQKSYFGDYLPNTYYLKVNGVTAWERVRTGLLSLSDYASRDFLMPLLIALIGLAGVTRLRTRASALLLLLFFVQTGYSVWVGGDYAEDLLDSANRFIAQGMPALFILFALAVDGFLREPSISTPASRKKKPEAPTGLSARQTLLACSIGIGALVVVSGEPWFTWVLSNAPMLRTDVQRVRLGLHIQAHTDPGAVVAVHAAGQIPYFADRTVVDLLGKNDPIIAKGPPATGFAPGHNKWNYEYSILQLQPDVIADNFHRLGAFLEDIPTYARLPSGIYVRTDSRLVDVDGLSTDY
jgi:arabinofuranosyltransferase